MKRAYKYDPIENEYNAINIQDGCEVEALMDDNVLCAQCGRMFKFEDMYSSKEITTIDGFEYAVCGQCYISEQDREAIAISRSINMYRNLYMQKHK